MKKSLLIIFLFFFSVACFSQTKQIEGSWIWKDSINKIQLLIKKNGTIEQGTGLAFEDVWRRDTRRGTYTFNKGILSITWRDESTESWRVIFKDHSKAAAILCTASKGQAKKTYLFLRIIDEEVIPDI